jgi:hypothetical protein
LKRVLIPLNRVFVIEFIGNESIYSQIQYRVLIPLNRVFVIELRIISPLIKKDKCFNPLESGLCY